MPKVLIVGAGLGGLVLAQYLWTNNIEFEIFERDESATSCVQGWAIVLTGSLPHQLRSIASPSAQPLESVSVARYTGKPDKAVFYTHNSLEPLTRATGATDLFIPANRVRLRTWLANDIPVQWSKRYVSHTVDNNGHIKITFADGRQASGDVLVGADGVGSCIRASFDPTSLPSLPIGLIAGETTIHGDLFARTRALGNSFFVVSGESFRLMVGLRDSTSDCSSGEYYWLFYWQDPAVAEHGVDCWPMNASQSERLQFVKDRLRDGNIHPSLAEVVEQQAPEGIHPPFVLRDRVPTMCPDGPVTLLGDSAHAMTPLQGQGANNAMQSAFALGKLLAKNPDASSKEDISRLLRDHEQETIPRATEWVLASRKAGVDFKNTGKGLAGAEHTR